MNNTYWLYIEPFVYISINSKKLLFYNTLNQKHYLFNTSSKLLNIVEQLKNPVNGYVISFDMADKEDSTVNDFLNKIKKSLMGDIIYQMNSLKKPYQFTPIYKIMDNKNYEVINENTVKRKNIFKNLKEITFFINSDCEQKCDFCDFAYKQLTLCHSKKNSNDLNIDLIKECTEKLNFSYLYVFKINGGNIFKYIKFKELMIYLNDNNKEKQYFVNYLNIKDVKNFIPLFEQNNDNKLKVFIHPPFNKDLLLFINKLINKINIELIFIVQSENDIILTEQTIFEYNIPKYSIQPLFNCKNIEFFKKNVFIEKQDILNRPIEMNDIFINKEVNSNYFGKIVIMNNGEVYTNINKPIIGNFFKDSIYNILKNALIYDDSWKETRIKSFPCNNCLYNALCPPISNYEHTIKKNNLCKVKVNI